MTSAPENPKSTFHIDCMMLDPFTSLLSGSSKPDISSFCNTQHQHQMSFPLLLQP